LVTLADINEQLDTVTFVELATGEFRIEGRVPVWALGFCPDLRATGQTRLQDDFEFLGGFIEQAHEEFLEPGETRIGSGPWTERDLNDVEHNLSALAVIVKNQLVIQISAIPEELRYHQRIFQKAREYSLDFEQSIRDKEQREVLLHAIVHDLSQPLTMIDGALHLSEDPTLPREEKLKLDQLMETQIDSAQNMIRSILEISLWEHKRFSIHDLKAAEAPGVTECVKTAIANFEPVFKQENIQLELLNHLGASEQQVVAEEDQLRRVLSNLLENALRFSPPGSKVSVLMEDSRVDTTSPAEKMVDQVVITVSDQGPGVSESLAESLFQRFVGESEFGGRGGFGLYYCQMCLHRWGGKIECISPGTSQGDKAPSDKGASFKLTLLKF